MNISENTMQILKNYGSINPNFIARKGNTITTVSEAKNILSSCNIEEQFEQDMGIYDLNEFWKDNAIASRYHKLYLTENEQPYLLTRLNDPVPEGFIVETVFEKAELVLYKKATPN